MCFIGEIKIRMIFSKFVEKGKIGNRMLVIIMFFLHTLLKSLASATR